MINKKNLIKKIWTISFMLHKYKYNGFIEFLLFLNNNNTNKK